MTDGRYFSGREMIFEKENKRLKEELTEARAVINAWHSTFGTTPLSNAIDRLEVAERDNERLRKELAEQKNRARTLAKEFADRWATVTRLRTENDELNRIINADESLQSATRLAYAMSPPRWTVIVTAVKELCEAVDGIRWNVGFGMWENIDKAKDKSAACRAAMGEK
ncbi:MAG: hypothetical protein WC551_10755 [Patescibacteria group bacterium]